MAYNQNIPQATDLISQSQSQLKDNFQAIKTLVDVNHVDFSNNQDQGKHNLVQMPVQGSIPAILAGEASMFNFLEPFTNANQVYISKRVLAVTTSIPITAASATADGWSYLPSGLLIKWVV